MVWNEIIAKWRTYGDAIGRAPEKQPPSNSRADFFDPYSKEESLPKDTTTSFQPENKGATYYSVPPKTDSYCNSCFRKYPTAEMKSTPNGPICAACSDSITHGIAEAPGATASTYRVEFTGAGREYFKIWIVNLFLSIITLGIYSPWAKVRKNKYFYRNTRISGSSFDYHGNPVAILKGRILAVIIVAALYFSEKINPAIYIIVVVLVALILPWMITRAFAFKLHNTSWRGIRMRFHGSVSDAYIMFLFYGFLTIVTFGICFPLLYRQIRLYLVNNAAFGSTKADLNVSAGDVFGVFIRTILISFLVAIVMSVAVGIFFGFLGSVSFKSGAPSPVMMVFIGLMLFAFYMLYRVIIQAFFRTRMANLIWNHTRLGTSGFESHQRARDLASIIASNVLLTFITLGIYWPWARMQLAKYYADTLLVYAPDGLSNFFADVDSVVAAAGDEVTEALDVDFSF
jgi:uncharacterized membrane protein YjgN (DUF898 family)